MTSIIVTTTESEQLTGKSDALFDLRSVFSEAAESSQVCVKYIDDAAEEGDSELVEFFKDVQEQEAWRAQKAKTLIGRR